MYRFYLTIFLLVTTAFVCTNISLADKKSQHNEPVKSEIKTDLNDKQSIINHNKLDENQDNSKTKEPNILLILKEYASLISAFGAIFSALIAALIALYLGSWKNWFQRPRLQLSFEEEKKEPFYNKLAFDPFDIPINIHGQITLIYRPGFNARVKIVNNGKTTAKNVVARIEKIKFYKNNKAISKTKYYHPTTIKWSGERNFEPVDIVPSSHFFLDLFKSVNETSLEIYKFNKLKINSYGIELDDKLLNDIINKDIQPSQEVYWNVWIDDTYERGIPLKYDIQGDIHIYIIVNAENCTPIKFKAIVTWTYNTWNCPNVKIRAKNKFIYKDINLEGESDD